MLKKLVLGILIAGMVGCSSDGSNGLGPDNADIYGQIQQVTVAADGSGQVRLAILGRGPDGGSNEHLFVLVNPGTPIKGGSSALAPSALVVGLSVAVNVASEVIDTFPPQYAATEIQVFGGTA